MPLTSLITRAGARELVIRISLALALFVSLFYGEWRYYEQRRLRRRTEHAEPE